LNWPVVKPFNRRRPTVSNNLTCSEKHSGRCDATAAMMCACADSSDEAKEAARRSRCHEDLAPRSVDDALASLRKRSRCSQTFNREA